MPSTSTRSRAPASNPQEIVAGADGNLWFTDRGTDRIGRITPTGTVTTFDAGIPADAEPWGISTGPDGNIWFTEVETGHVGRVLTGVVPHLDVPPTIVGSAAVGQILEAIPGVWSYLPTTTAYQWERCPVATPTSCAPIGGATGSTFLVTSADAGTVLRVVETATNLNGAATAVERGHPRHPDRDLRRADAGRRHPLVHRVAIRTPGPGAPPPRAGATSVGWRRVADRTGNGSMPTTRKRAAVGVAIVLTAVLTLTGCLEADVRFLASDAMNGRNNGTAGSVAAQDHILTYLEAWTEGANPAGTGRDAYKQTTTSGGTNLIGILPGTDLADEYVMVGGHYDGLGNSCSGVGPADSICNGATDNATGAAITLDILRHYVVNDIAPRRSIIFAFWDREEDGLRGSGAYVANPLVPLADTVAYVNFDIQGANLRPSGASSTFAIGAETGGPMLTDAVDAAAAPGTLDTWRVSLIFGQGRSDHAVLIANGVPSVFFSDSTGPCYHTVDDEAEVVDFDKLNQQAGTARRLVMDLASNDETPTLTTGLATRDLPGRRHGPHPLRPPRRRSGHADADPADRVPEPPGNRRHGRRRRSGCVRPGRHDRPAHSPPPAS